MNSVEQERRAYDSKQKALEEANVKEVIQSMHDKFRPSAYFLTMSSAIGAGYIIKEIYKNAWPNEPKPKIIFINSRHVARRKDELGGRGLPPTDEIIADKIYKVNFDYQVKRIKDKLQKYHVEGNVAVIDEMEGKALSWPEEDKPSRIFYEKSNTLDAAEDILKTAMKEASIAGNVVRGGFGDSEGKFRGFLIRPDDGSSTIRQIKRKGIVPSIDSGVSKLMWPKGEYAEYENAVQRRKYFRELGEKIGQELHQELESQKSLEGKLAVTTAIVGILGSFFFIGANLTGNAIANMSSSAANITGIILFCVGVVAALFCFKGKKT